MLMHFSTLTTHGIRAKDGNIGRIKDVYFDDTSWHIRYFIVDTSKWLPGRKILLSPESLTSYEAIDGHIPVNLTKEQIQSAPSINEHLPVSRQHEISLSQYYGWGHYWVPPAAMSDPFPIAPASIGAMNYDMPQDVREALDERQPAPDAHLHSCHDLKRYQVQTTDGENFSIKDFLIEPGQWRLNHFLIHTGGMFGGKDVILPPVFVNAIKWQTESIQIGLEKSIFEEVPEFNEETFNEDYERRIVKHYFDNFEGRSPRYTRSSPKSESTSFI